MGENIKVDEQRTAAYRLREQIRHTEGDITQTVHTLEQRLSPRYLRQRGARKAKRLMWRGAATVLDYAQRTSVQASLVGASALLMLLSNRKVREIAVAKRPPPKTQAAGPLAKAVGASALWMLMRKGEARKETFARRPPLSGVALAATAAKAFLSGARATKKTGTTRPGRKAAWSGVATALGAALSNYWYTHKQRGV